MAFVKHVLGEDAEALDAAENLRHGTRQSPVKYPCVRKFEKRSVTGTPPLPIIRASI